MMKECKCPYCYRTVRYNASWQSFLCPYCGHTLSPMPNKSHSSRSYSGDGYNDPDDFPTDGYGDNGW